MSSRTVARHAVVALVAATAFIVTPWALAIAAVALGIHAGEGQP